MSCWVSQHVASATPASAAGSHQSQSQYLLRNSSSSSSDEASIGFFNDWDGGAFCRSALLRTYTLAKEPGEPTGCEWEAKADGSFSLSAVGEGTPADRAGMQRCVGSALLRVNGMFVPSESVATPSDVEGFSRVTYVLRPDAGALLAPLPEHAVDADPNFF